MDARLLAAAELIGRCETLYDVGTDHGHLPQRLLERGLAQRAVCSDISTASLEKARTNLARQGLSAQARFVVTDGLAGLTPGEQDCVAICGMGAETIVDVLKETAALCCPVVAQANTKVAPLRRGLSGLGYAIVDERMVFERGRYYTVLRAQAGKQVLSDQEELLGPVLLKTRPPEFARYVTWRITTLEKALEGACADERDAQRVWEELKLLREAAL